MSGQQARPVSAAASDTDRHVGSAIILAGGLGTRLREAVPDLPKVMAPVRGRPFLAYQIEYWIGQGIRHFILSVGYRREVIQKHFGENYREAHIEYAVEDTPLGTGGGLLLAVEKLGTSHPFLLLNGDTYFQVPLKELADFHTRCRSDWTFSLFPTNEIGRYMGLNVDDDGRILSMQCHPGISDRLANGGVYLVHPEVLSDSSWRSGIELSLEKDILPALLSGGARLFGYACRGRFLDIGLPQDYNRSAEFLEVVRNDG
jgi:D-glycero-alpha-D-manno-heptose 1-phosphate guanylyltransferase